MFLSSKKQENGSAVRLRLNRVRALLCAVRDNRTVTVWIFKNDGNRQFPALYFSDLFQQQAGVLPLFCIPINDGRSNGLHDAIQYPLDIRYKTLAGGAWIDPHTEFGNFDCSSHAPHHPDCEILFFGSPEHVPHRLTVFEHPGIHELIAAGRTDSRDDENIRKIGNIFCGIQVFYLGITSWARTRNDRTQCLCPADLVARDLHRHRCEYHIPLVSKTDDVAVDILCHFF